ncbi:MAG: IS4 family transposase [Deltaproteobacteria bacterium]|nr:IS4 family transposase [Deltaproteobacteria bacterium]
MAKGRKKKAPIDEKSLQGFKYLRDIIPLFDRFHLVKDHHNRDLHYDQYLSFILLFYFNPVITSLRGIQEASHLKKVQKRLGVNATSLGSLSEAQGVFDAKLLAPLIPELARKAAPLEKDPKLKMLQQTLTAVDGSLLPALPKMLWALWVDDKNKAAKLHLEFDILKGVPTRGEITHGNANEKTNLRNALSPNKLYILDAGFRQYLLLEDIKKANSSFVVRMQDNAVWKTIEERPLTSYDIAAGATKDMVVQLGCKSKKDDLSFPVRVIEIHHKGDSSRPRPSRVSSKKTFRTTDSDYTFLLVTDRMDLPAETIALIYKYRWQIELFFRWFKCILGCRHLLAHSENGLTIQVYCALIASLLITLWTGCKPTKRTFEMLCFYFLGWADDEELANHIRKLKHPPPKPKEYVSLLANWRPGS